MKSKNDALIRAFESELEKVPRDDEFVIEPLKRPPTYGVFLWWPAEGDDWIHPDDLELARQLIPGPRVFRRVDAEDGYATITYGDLSLRIRPSMWLEVKPEGYEIGDLVEIKSSGGQQDPMVAHIHDIFWDNQQRRIEYVLQQDGRNLEKTLTSEDLRMVKPLDGFLNPRQLRMAERDRLM